MFLRPRPSLLHDLRLAALDAQAQTGGAERIRAQLETAAGAVEGLAREMTGISEAVSKVSDSVTRTREASQAMAS